jgi:hypothetical protein
LLGFDTWDMADHYGDAGKQIHEWETTVQRCRAVHSMLIKGPTGKN